MPLHSIAPESTARLPRRGLERLDLLLLSAEALDLNGGEAMVWMSEQMGFTTLFPNRVELWKRRCTNPCAAPLAAKVWSQLKPTP